MKLIILCAILSAMLAVSLASPVKIKTRDTFDSSDSSESSESQNVEKNSSSSEEERKQVKKVNYNLKNNNEEDNSADTSEEQLENKTVIKDEFIEHEKETERNKRAVDFSSHPSNQLSLKDEDSFKYNKHLKLKHLKDALESDESQNSQDISPRFARSADTSEESSSEEDKKGEDQGTHKHSGIADEKSNNTPAGDNIVAKNLATAPLDGLSLAAKSESSRRKRNLLHSSEEDQSVQEIIQNEVFIFSNEKQDSAEDFQNVDLKNIDGFVLNDKVFKKMEKSLTTKNSEEDYAQGCGGNGNHEDDSNESTDEDNETAFDKL